MSISPEAASRERMGEQAYLMLKLDTILNRTQNWVVDENGNRLTGKINTDRSKMEYLHFSCIRDGGSGHYNLTNNLTKNSDMAKFFKKIPPQFLSALMPTIKLFKVFYQPNTNDAKSLSFNEFHWRIPFDDSMTKTNSSSEFVENAVSDVLNHDGRLNGAGIKSFNYSYLGVNPADINSNISAELEIYFQSVHDLVKQIDVYNTDKRFGDKKPTNNWKSVFTYSDLVSISSRTKKSTNPPTSNSTNMVSNEMVPNEHYFRIKAFVGYADLDESYYNSLGKAANLSEDEIKSFRTAIKTSNVVLMLTPVSHDIKFNEDSSLSLKIQYQASLDSILYSNESDILKIGDDYKDIVNIRKRINNLLLLKDQQIDKIRQDSCEDPEEVEKLINELVNDPKNPFSDSALKNFRQELYVKEKSFYDGFIKSISGIKNYNSIGNRRPSIGIYEVDARPFDLGFDSQRTGFFRDEQSNAELAGVRLNALATTTGVITTVKLYSAANLSLDNPSTDIIPDPNDKSWSSFFTGWFDKDTTTDENVTDKISQKINEESEAIINGASAVGGQTGTGNGVEFNTANIAQDKFGIRFVFLGDILDIALDGIFNNPTSNGNTTNDIRKFIPLIGSMKIGIPTKQIATLNGKVTSRFLAVGESTKILRVCLADIPISLKLFHNFLFEKIIKTQRETYPFGLFIKDIISELIFPAISPTYLGRSQASGGYSTTNNTHLRFSTLNLTLPLKENQRNLPEEQKTDPILNFPIKLSKSSGLKYPTLDVQKIKTLKNVNRYLNLSNNSTIDYLFIYCSSQFPADQYLGNEKDDVNKGIFHFKLGTDSGIVKSINFSKTDSPFYREALAHQEGMQNGHMLRQVYDAEIRMFGNNIYRPGDIIYIDSVYSTPGREIELDVLNIEGYYMVTKVNTSFSDSLFETSINCVKKGFVKKEARGKLGDALMGTTNGVNTTVVEVNEKCIKT